MREGGQGREERICKEGGGLQRDLIPERRNIRRKKRMSREAGQHDKKWRKEKESKDKIVTTRKGNWKEKIATKQEMKKAEEGRKEKYKKCVKV